MSAKSDTESSSSSSDDEYPPDVSEEFEKSFFKTLSSLKTDDPSIYDKEKKFFDDASVNVASKIKVKKNKQSKLNPLTLLGQDKDYDNLPETDLPYSIEQQKLKESFKSLMNDSDDDGDLLLPSKKTDEDLKKEEADYIQWLKGQKQEIGDKATEHNLKNLRDYWNSNDLNEDEEFLRDYILNKKFLDKDDSADDDELSEDSETLEAQENFEQEYNFRYETGDNLVRRFPRNVDDSLRRRNSKRSEKRAKIKERKQIEKTKKQDEINRQKKIKAKEIAERLEKLKELTGNEKLAFNDNDIIEDFNPEEHDKKMSEMFNDDYYKLEDEEKPTIDYLDDFDNEMGGEYYEHEENFDEETDVGTSSRKDRKKTRTKRKKERKKKSYNDIAAIEKPVYDPKVHASYQKYMDEYYEMDCEDFIYDMPCRFKYKQVEPNDYGLSIEEILAADDKELNSWSSMKKITKIRSAHVEKNEVKIYKLKAQNESLKKKILPSLYKVDEGETSVGDNESKNAKKVRKKKSSDNPEDISNNVMENSKSVEHANSSDPFISVSQKTKKPKSKKRKVEDVYSLPDEYQTHPKQVPEVSLDVNASSNGSNPQSQTFSKKSFKKSYKYNKGYKAKKNHDFHDSRLSAYGINPKKFKVKS